MMAAKSLSSISYLSLLYYQLALELYINIYLLSLSLLRAKVTAIGCRLSNLFYSCGKFHPS
jgi:hypothetical protein